MGRPFGLGFRALYLSSRFDSGFGRWRLGLGV